MRHLNYSLFALVLLGSVVCSCSHKRKSYIEIDKEMYSKYGLDTVSTKDTVIVVDSIGSSENSNEKPKVSSGYIDEREYKPTISKKGKYKTVDGRNSQVQYQGSQEQKSDLNAIDEYSKNHPGF
jgi:hypothetical protein